jgi:N-methylhydantoinase B
MDPILLEIFKNLYASVAEEMGASLVRSAFSPNITERRDCSCAVFDGTGAMVAQAAHIPVHLGSTPLSVRIALAESKLEAGDVVILNDPFRGGTHLPDVTTISPVFLERGKRPTFVVANRAHHADVGGSSPGSMAPSREIFEEGIRIPPVHLFRRGEICPDVLSLFLSNVRNPDERRGDLMAQVAANRTGEGRLREIVSRHGASAARRYARELIEYSARRVAALLESIPDGTYEFADSLDDDGTRRGAIRIRVAITIRGRRARVDFTGTDPEVDGNLNANLAITLSAVFYVFRSLVGEGVPTNSGCLAPIEVEAPEGTVVNARYPRAVAGGNVETSQRIVDVLFGALAGALPDRIPAASAGTMNNLVLGGYDPFHRRLFSYYETIGGGMGARPSRAGLSGLHTHMTNTLNTPIEAVEHAYPLRVVRYGLRRHSGGTGRHRGGDGLVREIEALAPLDASLLTERRASRPWGLAGGGPGKPGHDELLRGGRTRDLPGKSRLRLEPGDRIRVSTPGGGGHGGIREA